MKLTWNEEYSTKGYRMNFPGLGLINRPVSTWLDTQTNSNSDERNCRFFPTSWTNDDPWGIYVKTESILVHVKCFQTSHFTSQILFSVIAACSPPASLHCHIWKALFLSCASSFLRAQYRLCQQWRLKPQTCFLWFVEHFSFDKYIMLLHCW